MKNFNELNERFIYSKHKTLQKIIKENPEYKLKSISPKSLSVGQKLVYTYCFINKGCDCDTLRQILMKEDSSGNIKEFNSIKEVMKYYNVTKYFELSSIGKLHLIGENNQSMGVYIFEKRFCYGSGAEPVSFYRCAS